MDGTYGRSGSEVRVWDLETLRPLRTLRQPAGENVLLLVWYGGEVWGAVGEQVVVPPPLPQWERRGMTGGRA